MVTAVTDARSNANDQIAHAATVLKRSPDLRKMFEAISRGGKTPKTVRTLMKLTRFSQVRVSQLARKLADEILAEQVKVDGKIAYAKDRFLASRRSRIIALATNPEKLKSLPTKTSPKVGFGGAIRLRVPRAKVMVTHVTADDIDQFAKIRRIKAAPAKTVSEATFKKGVQKIIGEAGKFQDWGGEPNDLFTTRVRLGGKRIAAAFAFKGPGKSGLLTPAKLGKNGDQIQRLFKSPAELFIVQYHAQVSETVIEEMKTWATVKSLNDEKRIYYGIIDGQDSHRLIAAYPTRF